MLIDRSPKVIRGMPFSHSAGRRAPLHSCHRAMTSMAFSFQPLTTPPTHPANPPLEMPLCFHYQTAKFVPPPAKRSRFRLFQIYSKRKYIEFLSVLFFVRMFMLSSMTIIYFTTSSESVICL